MATGFWRHTLIGATITLCSIDAFIPTSIGIDYPTRHRTHVPQRPASSRGSGHWVGRIQEARQLRGKGLTGDTSAPSTTVDKEKAMQKESLFEAWAAKAGLKAPKLRHAVFADTLVGDLRGLQAIKPTSATENLVTVPASSAITLTSREECPFNSWVSASFWASQKWYVKLALKLLWERQLGPASSVAGYVQVLPEAGSFETLIHWTDEELDMLKYPRLANSARRQRTAWDTIFQDLKESCPEGAGRMISREDLVWAMECVLSRAFKGRFGGGKWGLALSGGVVASAAIAYGLTEEPWWVLLAALALLPISIPEMGAIGAAVLDGKKPGDDYVLVPFVDSMNHVTLATTELAFSPLNGDLQVSVDRGYEAGEQAYISYGLKSNDELLQFYGFVEADCPSDTYIVENIVERLGVPAARMSDVRRANLGEAAQAVTIMRGTEIVSPRTLEALSILMDVVPRVDGDSVIWRELKRICQEELQRIIPLTLSERSNERSVRERLAMAFRQQKTSVLEEALQNLEKRGV